MEEEYLTREEAAALLKISAHTLSNKVSAGVFKRGVHYFSPKGLGPRFKKSAVIQWLEERDETQRVVFPFPREKKLTALG